MPVSLRYSFFSDWQPAIFCRQCKASSSSFPQCESLSTSTRSTAIDTASVLRPFAVISVFLSSRVRRLMRYLEKAMLLRDLSVMALFFCLMLLFMTRVCRARLFSLSLSSSTPMSPTWQSSRNNSRSFVQCLDSPIAYRDLLVIRCQLMLRLSDSSSAQASVLRKQLTPSSSTEVACRSSSLRRRTQGDSARMTSPSLETSELPQSTSCSSRPIHPHRAISTSDSSVIWLSARLSTLRSGRTVSSQRVCTAASVMKLKFWERSRVVRARGLLIVASSLRDSSLMLEFLKESSLTFSIVWLQMTSLSSASSVTLSCSVAPILSFRTGTRQWSIIIRLYSNV